MATATERAAIGAEEARLAGKGPVGRAVEGVRNAATGRDDNLAGRGGVDPYNNNNNLGGRTGVDPFNNNNNNLGGRTGVDPYNNNGTAVEGRGLFGRDHQRGGLNNGGMLGHTEEEMARLRINTHITAEGDAYCPNPNLRDLPKEFETRVQVVQRYPEMRTVEKTDFVKEIHHEERLIIVPRTRVIHDDVERIDRVPVVRQVPRTRMEMTYRVVAEEREVVDMVQEVDYMDVPRVEMVPRVITEDIEERVLVPTVREVPVTRMVEVPTGNYCEAPAGQFVTPGDFDLLHHKPVGGGLLPRTRSVSSSSSDDEIVDNDPAYANPDGTVAPGGRRKKKSLLRRVLHQ
jgi:hypothetical protein